MAGKLAPIITPKGRSISHGSVTGYVNHGCKCEACRRAWADYHVDYRAGKIPPRDDGRFRSLARTPRSA